MQTNWPAELFVLILVLAALALIAVGPLLLVVFLAKRIKDKRVRAFFILALAAGPVALLYFTGFIGSSAARIERDHGVAIPRSASHIHCGGFVSLTTFLDEYAIASFEIPRNDLPGFLSEVKGHARQIFEPDPSTGISKHKVPGNFGDPVTTLDCASGDGNSMHMDVYSIDSNKVGVWIRTVWN